MRIGLDLDDVVLDFMNPFLRTANNKYELKLKYSDVKDYDLSKLRGMTKTRVRTVMREMSDRGTMMRLKPLEDSTRNIRELMRQGHKISYLTGRNSDGRMSDDTHFNLEWYGIDNPVHFGHDKGKTARKIHLDLMVEDNPYYVLDVRSHSSARTIIYDQEWNRDIIGFRARGWIEVMHLVREFGGF